MMFSRQQYFLNLETTEFFNLLFAKFILINTDTIKNVIFITCIITEKRFISTSYINIGNIIRNVTIYCLGWNLYEK